MTSYDSKVIPQVLQQLLNTQRLLPARHQGDVGRGEGDSLYLFDLDALEGQMASLIAAFPEPHFRHCYAVKAAPMHFVVKAAIEAGLGIEAASLLELENGLRAGCPTERLVFDSPAKTYGEIEYALARGVHLNANCLAEIDRIAEVLQSLEAQGKRPAHVSVGLRINPLIGSGKIEELSVSTITSKFGVTLLPSNRGVILDKYKAYTWLNGLHIHVGSQGFNMEQMAAGVRVLVEFAREVEEVVGAGRITVLDIGGGLSANYHGDEVNPSYEQLSQVLRKHVPELFSNTSRRVVTEFGRSLVAKACWTVSRVEYAFQTSEELRTAIVHSGADSMLRECYCVGKFYHRMSAYTPLGQEIDADKDGRPVCHHNIAGPLCFAGDVVSRAHPLPRLEAGDWLVIHDTGANTLALFSRHCSRPAPAVLGYRSKEGQVAEITVLQESETPEDVLGFWGARPSSPK